MVNEVPVNTIEITEKAAEKVKSFAKQDGKTSFALRVAVKGGGCSGLTYDLDITDKEASSDEKIIIQHEVEVRVPKKSFIFLAGTTLDFSDGLNGKGFVFSNPNAKKSCGCGTSFAV
ncbi:MAG: iron-sulfur cluster assembly accessory protein [Chloroflexi bacterium]|nr:iron-sulfur cluster assembly accessory protein [Chloroflexota bacterium]|tara:strand:- start:234 stop:584 length:351 start_codon:yes stop_codon:yes gene_type:complete